MDTDNSIFHLKIKTQKVQSFIFKVPKLKAMLGANSLIGEFFAIELPDLRNMEEKYPIPEIWKTQTKEINLSDNEKWREIDNIKNNFDKGVICSAGGHFESFFNEVEDTKAFIKEVKQKAKEKIPGVRLSFFIKKYDSLPEKFKDFDENGELEPLPKDTSDILIDNPYFYPSGQDGENPQLISGYRNASGKIEKDSKVTKDIKVAGDKFYKGKSQDYLCLFLKELTKENDKIVKFSDVFENNLEELAKLSLIPNNNKIAIITIDGNAMGNRFRDERENAKNLNTIQALVSFEKFWFNQRETFRNALEKTLKTKAHMIKIDEEKKAIEYDLTKYSKKPFQIMMLGGDDLLIVTVPEIAIPLVKTFGEKIKEITKDLSVSAGIAFVKYSFPFSQGHELAESLLSSAKVKSRIWKKVKKIECRNAIDWHVHFPTGTEEIDEIRKQNYMLQYNDKTEILTRRPCTMEEAYRVWGDSENLYKEIINQSKENDLKQDSFENTSGRNKYKGLRTLLKTGVQNVNLFGNILDIKKEFLKFNAVSSHFKKLDKKSTLNTALDVIELMDFHKHEEEKRSK